MDLRVIRERYRDLFGCVPRVDRSHAELDARLHVDVLRCDGEPDADLTSWATVGLCRLDTGTVLPDGRPVRVELLGVGPVGWDGFAAAFVGCAADLVRPGHAARPGTVSWDAFGRHDTSITTPHALLIAPSSWPADDLRRLARHQDDEPVVVTWLQVLPVTEAEADLARTQGVAAAEGALSAAHVHIEDLHRPSAA